MTTHVTLSQAKDQLAELVAKAKRGELVVIEDSDHVHLELVVSRAKKPRVFGQHAGKGRVADNFNDPLPESIWSGQPL